MARPQKTRCICSLPGTTGFYPENSRNAESVNLTYDEYEVIRLLDYMHLTQEECARRMVISRPTVTRIYNEARSKIADMLVNGKPLVISGGDVTVCTRIRPECADEKYCCHKNPELVRGHRTEGTVKIPDQN